MSAALGCAELFWCWTCLALLNSTLLQWAMSGLSWEFWAAGGCAGLWCAVVGNPSQLIQFGLFQISQHWALAGFRMGCGGKCPAASSNY